MKVNQGPPSPPVMSPRGNVRANPTAAPTQAPLPQAPRNVPSTPSPARGNRFETAPQTQRSGISVPSRDPSPQERSALNNRRGTLGYGSSSPTRAQGPRGAPPPSGSVETSRATTAASSSSPPAEHPDPWPISEDKKTKANSALKDNTNMMAMGRPVSGASINQYIAQGDLEGSGPGLCSAFTKRWTTAEMANPGTASARFNHGLRHDTAALKHHQAEDDRLVDTRQAALDKHKANDQELKAHERKIEDKQQYLDTVNRQIQGHPEGMAPSYLLRSKSKTENELQKYHQQLPGLQESARQSRDTLNARSGELDRLRYDDMGVSTVHQKVLHDNGSRRFASEIREAIADRPGIYEIEMIDAHGRTGHVMGLANKGDGQYKFMDPNSAEFSLNGERALTEVLSNNSREMGYMGDRGYHGYILRQITPPPNAPTPSASH